MHNTPSFPVAVTFMRFKIEILMERKKGFVIMAVLENDAGWTLSFPTPRNRFLPPQRGFSYIS